MSGMELAALAYGLNSLWQVALVALGAMAIAHLAGRGAAEPARARYRVWVGALLAEVLLPACPVHPERVLRGLLALLGARRPVLGHGGVRVGLTAPALAAHGMPRLLVAGLVAVYVASILYFLGRLVHGLAASRALPRDAEELALTPQQAQAWRSACGGRARVLSAPGLLVPVTVGVRHPALLLPQGLLERISPEDQAALFAHEAAHIRRHDFAWNLLYTVLALPIAYHPLFWWTRARLAESREMICDSVAASALSGAGSYSRSLLRLAELLVQGGTASPLHAIGLLDAHTFERRLMNLTVKRRHVGRASRAALTAGCVLLALATGGSALALRLEPSVPGGQAHLSGAEQAARLVSKTMPVYPAEAKAKHDTLDGRVVLHVLIDEAGIPQQISVLQSLRRDYDVSALEAVRQWRWSPYVVEGVPSAVETTVTVTYSLDHSQDKTEK